jgi:hypothetical protein
VGSLVVGRFCWSNLNIWGGNQSDWSGIAPFGLVAAAGGIVYGFLMLAGVAVSTLISGGAVAAPHPLPDVKPQTDAQPVVANATVEEQKWLWALWVALLEIVAFNLYCQFFTQLGRHGRLWLGLIDQIPYCCAVPQSEGTRSTRLSPCIGCQRPADRLRFHGQSFRSRGSVLGKRRISAESGGQRIYHLDVGAVASPASGSRLSHFDFPSSVCIYVG